MVAPPALEEIPRAAFTPIRCSHELELANAENQDEEATEHVGAPEDGLLTHETNADESLTDAADDENDAGNAPHNADENYQQAEDEQQKVADEAAGEELESTETDVDQPYSENFDTDCDPDD